MDEYSTTATEDKEVAVISDSEEEDSNDETFDGSPRITLPPEVWANVIECEYHTCLISIIYRTYLTRTPFLLR